MRKPFPTSLHRITRLLAAAACAMPLLLASAAQAATVMAPSSSWRYTFTDPTANPLWATQFPTLPGWQVGNAPFGNRTSGDFAYTPNGTFWPTSNNMNDDLWIGRRVDFSGFDTASARWFLGVDNGYKLYVNGVLISQANAEGYTSRWEYNGTFPALNPGENLIALALGDHGVATAFDMQITANTTAIPLPAPAALMLGGLCLFGLIGRRHGRAAPPRAVDRLCRQ